MTADREHRGEQPTGTPKWNRVRILRRLSEVLEPAEFEALQSAVNARIGDGVDTDSAEGEWLADVVLAAETLPLPAVPGELSATLLGLFDGRVRRQQIEAVLIHDSRVEQSLAGVRGDGDDDGWTLSFSSDVGQVLVDIWPTQEGYDLETQLMTTSPGGPGFVLTLDGSVRFDAESDRLGRARLESVPPGSHHLTVACSTHDIVTRIDLDQR